MLLARAVCNFSTSENQKVVWSLCVLYILTLKCASRRSGVQFFHILTSKRGPRPSVFFSILTCKCASRYSGVEFLISPLNSYLRTRHFSEPTFRPSGNTNHWKNTAFRDFPSISRDCIFYLLTLLSSDSASLRCFSSFHIIGS